MKTVKLFTKIKKMSNDFNIFRAKQIEAAQGILEDSESAFFRKVCRWYSKNFSTPLDEVLACSRMQWDDMLLHFYEDSMENVMYNDIFDMACANLLPEMQEKIEEENRLYAEALVEEQKRTLEKKKLKEKKKIEKKEPQNINMSFNMDGEEDV